MSRRIKQSDVERMLYLRERGRTNEQIARDIGFSYATVLKHIGLQDGLVGEVQQKPPPPPYTVEFISKVIRLTKSGACVRVDDAGLYTLEYEDAAILFDKKGFKAFVEDLILAVDL